jgi:hypothetical protein
MVFSSPKRHWRRVLVAWLVKSVVVVKTRGRDRHDRFLALTVISQISFCTDTSPVLIWLLSFRVQAKRKRWIYLETTSLTPSSSPARHTQEGRRGTRRQKKYGLTYTPPRCQSVCRCDIRPSMNIQCSKRRRPTSWLLPGGRRCNPSMTCRLDDTEHDSDLLRNRS